MARGTGGAAGPRSDSPYGIQLLVVDAWPTEFRVDSGPGSEFDPAGDVTELASEHRDSDRCTEPLVTVLCTLAPATRGQICLSLRYVTRKGSTEVTEFAQVRVPGRLRLGVTV